MSTSVTLADRIGAACGAAYILFVGIGNQLNTGSGTDPHPSGAKDLADFATSPTVVQRIGITLELSGFLAFAVFLAWFAYAQRGRSSRAPWLASAAGVFGVITLGVNMASAAPMWVGQLDHQELTPAMARVLTDLNGAAFVLAFPTYGMFVALAGAALLVTGLLGRVAGWAGVVIGSVLVLATLATQADPVHTNVVPFLLGFLWLLVVGIRLAWRGPRVPATEAVEASAALMA